MVSIHYPLLKIFPKNTQETVNQWFGDSDFDFKLSGNRKTKLGDFRVFPKTKKTQITINKEMEPYLSFFIFTHEYAHYLIWKNYKRTKAHGKEWKNIFARLLSDTIQFYPEALIPHISHFTQNPKASFNADANLLKAFRNLQPDSNLILLEALELQSVFKLNNRLFIKQEKRRTRFICIDERTKQKYLINALAEVEPAKN